MSAAAHAHSPSVASHAGEHGAHEGKFHIFVQVAMILAVITGVEILIIYLPLVKWLVTSTLIVLSLVKFMFVIFVFMHLKWDKLFCTILFFIGLVLAGGTMWALLMIHSAEAARPVGAAYDQG